ncbi:helix-turn-helix domain-containing protein [Chryseobacterium sp. PET-29]|uniref:helix-turn-helix domain-containing protein n=1 Tax=Chryseobacterium sp. PET-29 TaxID=2983267 RepID=UPI0021E590EC|nr:helix-turn-helix transcriptional regulator [Chryseobacterium sp. PET-29]
MKEKSEILVKFGSTVRNLRIQKGLSQEQLAHLSDVHRTYIGMIERAEKNVTLTSIQKIAYGLGVSIIDLLEDDRRTN